MTENARLSTVLSGKRVVVVVYVGVVALAGVLGYVLGIILPAQKGVEMAAFGPIAFEITPVSFALYGMAMLAVSLGVLLALVQFVARYDDAAVE
ncbi:cox cluster protein [Halorubellus sp. JP-L1]|uniref:DUF7520 family protein n=1 Tax=Halorubellus sp. JP-L1 TaxID=2715753 RepID=UPI00140C869C|nr:cox cluster protein [Halorubellus sp. JP-L1]NHN40147.1 cox cluster protein [Halorubellus sp. JP-L1]